MCTGREWWILLWLLSENPADLGRGFGTGLADPTGEAKPDTRESSLTETAASQAGTVSLTDRLDWTFQYDDSSRIVRLQDPGGRVTRIGYDFDAQGLIRAVTKHLPDDSKVQLRFDSQDR